MTAMAPAVSRPAGGTGIPFGRIVGVELRKMTDTRAGRWLMIAIVGLTLLVDIIFLLAAHTDEKTFFHFMTTTGTPQGILLPVLGIMLITQEWGQNTALTTFTIVPRRGTVVGAKVVAAIILAAAALVVAFVVGSLMTALGGYDHAWQGVGLDDFGKFSLLQFVGILEGLGFAMLWLNTAGAIVTYFLAPQIFTLVYALISQGGDSQKWFDFQYAQGPLSDGSHMSGQEWAQLMTSGIIWVVIPFCVGLWRILRAEIK